MEKRNALYAQSGGVTSVINASACGVIETSRLHKDKIGKVFAAHNGILGALREELIDTNKETAATITALKHTPASAFGSCRYKLKSLEESRAEYERLVEVFKAHDIGYFFYNGGGDSADTCLKVSQIADTLGYPVQAIHVPKTIDNDLPITDNCPGFGSVAKYVAVSILEASLDVASMCNSSTKVFILEVMGRHAGWIAGAGGLAARQAGEPPHIILFPEIAFDKDKFLARAREAVEEHGYCSIVASEGARYEDGNFLADAGTVDAFGHKQLGGVAPTLARMVNDELGYKNHWALADYLQRSARHIASEVDVEQAYAVGRSAVQMALAGKNSVMPAIERGKGKRYSWKIVPAPLDQVANVEKKMPREYITEDGMGLSEAGREYMEPLIQGENYPPYRRGIPTYAKLKKVFANKQLNNFE